MKADLLKQCVLSKYFISLARKCKKNDWKSFISLIVFSEACAI